MKCSICGKDCSSLFKVNHRDLGRVKICKECWENEIDYCLHPSGCSCCH